MTTKWTTQNVPPDANGSAPAAKPLGEQFVVLLLYGKNSFGDKIYSYLKITLNDLQNLKNAIRSGQPFSPSDFGTVIAAGRDEPPENIRREIASTYQVVNTAAPAAPAASIPTEKKAWDEF
jgi:hypothetical protein